jgi:hypothetical protein
MSSPYSKSSGLDYPQIRPLNEKNFTVNEKNVLENVTSITSVDGQWSPPEDWLARFKDEYSGVHGGETLPPGSDLDRVAKTVLTLNEQQAVEILKETVESHHQDYTFSTILMARIKVLLGGSEAAGISQADWAYETCKIAGLVHNWSPYTEVRAVTVPYDDPDEPCETFRAYVLGLFWVCVCTAINTCECLPYFSLHLNTDANQSSTLASPGSQSLDLLSSCSLCPWAALWHGLFLTGDSQRKVANATHSTLGNGLQRNSFSPRSHSPEHRVLATLQAYWLCDCQSSSIKDGAHCGRLNAELVTNTPQGLHSASIYA